MATEVDQFNEPKGPSPFKTFDSPKKRGKSDIDAYTEVPERNSVLSGGGLTQPVRQMYSPKFGQRSSRSNNDVLYQKDASPLVVQYPNNADLRDPLAKSYQPSLMNYGGNQYAKKSSSFLQNHVNPTSTYTNAQTPSYLYSQYLQNSKSWSAQPTAKTGRIPLRSATPTSDHNQCPFTNQ